MPKYGWKPSKPNQQDAEYSFAARLMHARLLPKGVDLRPHDNPIYDQLSIGSCVSNSVADGCEYVVKAAGYTAEMPSRLFIYYNGRVLENTVHEDSGLEVRDGLTSVAKQGYCTETLWPYNVAKFKVKPTKDCYAAAIDSLVKSYHSIYNANLTEMKTCLADGFPIVGGFTVYESFESNAVANSGKVPMPSKHESTVGGHCVVLVGYDDTTKCFIVRNSWGDGWGDKGYCYMPYAYWTNPALASDCWTIRAVK